MSRRYKIVFISFFIMCVSGTLVGCVDLVDKIYDEATEVETSSYGNLQDSGLGREDSGDFKSGKKDGDRTEGNEQAENTEGEVNWDIKEAQKGLFYFETLDGQQQDVYAQIYEAIVTRKEKVLSTLDTDTVDRVFQFVMNDHPEIFYSSAYEVERWTRNDQILQLKFQAKYHMTEEEVQANQKDIDAYVEACLGQMPGELDQYGQVKYIYDYVISNTEYELNSENNQNICSVFLTGKSVCQGYAKATQYLLQKLGFEITLGFGKVQNGEAHTWNLVRVDGDYYYMDPTWGDAGYSNQNQPVEGRRQPVNYEYFLITTEQLLKTHTIENMVPLPACVVTRNNYYIREGLYFTYFDEQKMTEIFENAYAAGQDYVTVMCADSLTYEGMKQRMISEQEVFRYLHSSQTVSYTYNDQLYTFIFWL